ncbi:transposase [Aurantiacibacter aquimixticola]|uniref:Transposase n=1 Tax=Aurantiacibacter aquimixticola TaxID=1958945 RepID=A0A419RQE8_9SPHN|nr:transposase [Aurantiacibacter aquimixticola]RJY07990.1 transposase [Aurantiacibacter aquimixticola]
MPRVIPNIDDTSCELGDCIAALHEFGFRPDEEESLLHGAKWLRKLGNNRDFLGDILVEELKHGVCAAEEASDYGPQVVMLSTLGSEFYMRANFWPSVDEHMFRASGQAAFSYEVPHDHNFDFLTLGYFGPGYASDYYEYDFEAVAGAVGEKAGLRFIERSTLDPGKLMHYRAHLDVHSQMPPDSLSVSINIMHAGGAQGWLDQYRFDIERDEIAGVISAGGTETFLRIATGLGGPEALDLAEHFAKAHPSDRMRLVALEAQAGVLDPAERDALWRRAESSGSRLVAREATRMRRELVHA